jgi:hypothetical protein
LGVPKGKSLLDLLMLLMLAGAFAGAMGYVRGCARLTQNGKSLADRHS